MVGPMRLITPDFTYAFRMQLCVSLGAQRNVNFESWLQRSRYSFSHPRSGYRASGLSGASRDHADVAESTNAIKDKKIEGYFSVPKNQRISYCQIIQGHDFGRGMNVGVNSGAWVAAVNHTPPLGADAANWFSVFYLPWAAGQTFRTTLKNPAGALPHGIAMPEIFFNI